MRAQNQQDLIYKRGQAGITKASVTIVFDNSDRENSPPGMENYAQITVTRQVCNFASYPLPHPPICCHSFPVLINIITSLDRSSEYLQISFKWPQGSTEYNPDNLSERAAQHQQP